MEATIECKINDVVDLSANITWTLIKMVDGEESNDEEEEVKAMVEALKTLLFCEKRKRFSLHHLPLKKRMKDCTISYVDLLCPD